MTVEVLKTPTQVPGYKMQEMVRDVVRVAYSTEVTVSTTLTTATLFRVPANTLVLGVGLNITTEITGGSSDVSIKVGDTDNAESLLYTEVSTTLINPVGGRMKEYSAAQDIIMTFTTGADAAGAFKVWLQYKTDSDKQEIHSY